MSSVSQILLSSAALPTKIYITPAWCIWRQTSDGSICPEFYAPLVRYLVAPHRAHMRTNGPWNVSFLAVAVPNHCPQTRVPGGSAVHVHSPAWGLPGCAAGGQCDTHIVWHSLAACTRRGGQQRCKEPARAPRAQGGFRVSCKLSLAGSFLSHSPSPSHVPSCAEDCCGHSQCFTSRMRCFWTFLASLMPGMNFPMQRRFRWLSSTLLKQKVS